LKANRNIREIFYNNLKWNEKYDFIEFCVNLFDGKYTNLNNCLNTVLKEEFAGYSLINGVITPIIEEEEIIEIKKALSVSPPITVHLKTALHLLSDKIKPNYRNSIKESISAVEAMCNKMNNNSEIPLGDALRIIERKGQIEIHGALKSAFSSLYGWSSSEEGIRHSLMDKPNVDQEDARFMLVACSAFINYLKIKSDKAGITIN
jgi:hypothetical protein